MCNCMKKAGGCSSKRGELRKFKVQLNTLYNTSSNAQLRNFLKGELDTLKSLLKDLSFCPTTEFNRSYKTETNATISELK